ncbi:uncharacterized protein DUF1905 [Salana multivorans]|uniref:Uncharacterized protein DUF1905 n=1 Tax=Salana multivorans TaxID=120377 RepID=A0A3N2D7Q8_9MICO|nr:DUF1905 domain-containing protein [Salana multivorans]ROR95810.1 uncharacterized protein DUF1905 [Salana multivorans]
MDWTFEAEVVEWRGPAPFVFARMPVDVSDDVREAARDLVYWGQVPVRARLGGAAFDTALFPKDDAYLVPLRVAVRRAEGTEVGDVVRIGLSLRTGRARP